MKTEDFDLSYKIKSKYHFEKEKNKKSDSEQVPRGKGEKTTMWVKLDNKLIT